MHLPLHHSVVSFGRYRLLPTQRLLFEGERPVRLGSRALDVLIVLVENAGKLVAKEDLIARVWPNVTVEESNLKVHIAALRRALGDGQAGNRYIATITGRGYSFVAQVLSAVLPSTPPSDSKTRHNLPAMLMRLVGCDDIIVHLATRLGQSRFLTIVGAGGVGKTSVALAVAEATLPTYQHGAWFVDLSPITDPRMVLNTIAAALGLEISSSQLLPELICAVQDRQMLVVLDNCEQVVEAAATFAAAVLSQSPGLNILATSREPLRAGGEHVHRLQPLTAPPVGSRPTAAEALAFPAVQLFVERAGARLGDYELSDADAPYVANICSQLDGIPLAIEFAAAQVEAFGVRDLASLLGDRLMVLTGGSRRVAPRHQTIRDTLDWSYNTLPGPEQRILRSLTVFAGPFALQAAEAVGSDEEIPTADIPNLIANLVAKSLIVADVSGVDVLYRLLETTKVYARDKLVQSGRFSAIARRHMEHCQDACERLALHAEPTGERVVACRRLINEVSSSLEWAFTPEGEPAIGVTVTFAVMPLLFEFFLLAEARRFIERALAQNENVGVDKFLRLQLQAAYGASTLFMRQSAKRGSAIWREMPLQEDARFSVDDQFGMLWRLWSYRMYVADFKGAVRVVASFRRLAVGSGSMIEHAIADRLLASPLHYMGELAASRRLIEAMLSRYGGMESDMVRFQYDQRILGRIILARVLWLQGFPEKATRLAQIALEAAIKTNHRPSICFANAIAVCPVALLVGDCPTAERAIEALENDEDGVEDHLAWARDFRSIQRLRRDDLTSEEVNAIIPRLESMPLHVTYASVICALGEHLGRAGRAEEGLSAVEFAVYRADHTEEKWCLPELLRVKGELARRRGDSRTAIEAYTQSIECARRQGALSWELRTWTSYVQFLKEQDESGDALGALAEVYSRFTEGFDSVDLRRARLLLATPQGIRRRYAL